MWGVIKTAVNSDLTVPLDELIRRTVIGDSGVPLYRQLELPGYEFDEEFLPEGLPQGRGQVVTSPDGGLVIMFDAVRVGDAASGIGNVMLAVNGDSVTQLPGLPVSVFPRAQVHGAAFSPDGRFLVLVHGTMTPRVSLYTVNGTALTLITNQPQGTAINFNASSAAFSPDSRMMVVSGAGGLTAIYSINAAGTVFSRETDLPANQRPPAAFTAHKLRFSPDGRRLVMIGNSAPNLLMYAVNGMVLSRMDDITFPSDMPFLGGGVGAFSFETGLFVFGRQTAPQVVMLELKGNRFVRRDVPGGMRVTSAVHSVSISADGKMVAVGYNNAPNITVYWVDGAPMMSVPVVREVGVVSLPQAVVRFGRCNDLLVFSESRVMRYGSRMFNGFKALYAMIGGGGTVGLSGFAMGLSEVGGVADMLDSGREGAAAPARGDGIEVMEEVTGLAEVNGELVNKDKIDGAMVPK